MANVVVILKIMPKSVDVDLKKVEEQVKPLIEDFDDYFHNAEIIPIAFGISSLNITFLRDEKKGGTDKLEESIAKLADVESVEVIDVRRAFG